MPPPEAFAKESQFSCPKTNFPGYGSAEPFPRSELRDCAGFANRRSVARSRRPEPLGMSNLVPVKDANDLRELLRGVISSGGFGMTLRSGEMAVLHTTKGAKRIDGVIPTHEEITGFMRQLTGSRCVREFRDSGVTRFMVPFEGE